MLSKCPNCHSTFEIDQEQLNAANGLVRCGVCLHVFNGQEASTESTTQINTTPFAEIDQELEEIEAQIDAIAKKRTKPTTSKSIDDELAHFTNLAHAFQSQETNKQKINTSLTSTQPSDSFDITVGKPEHFTSTEEYRELGWEADTKAQNHLPTQKIAPQSLKRRNKLEEDIDNFFATSDTIQHKGSGTEQYQKKQNLRIEKNDTLDTLGLDTLNTLNINDEPLNLQIEEAPKKNLPILTIIGISIVFLLLCIITYGASQFEQLSQDPKWRPKLSIFCGIFQCTLPPTYSTKYIKLTSSNMTAINDKLEVNAVIYNTNPHFDMPFPDMIVLFFDRNHKLIAELNIRPDEYRQGEIARMKYLPTNTSAHITFLLNDPSNGTLNYKIQFKYPKNLGSVNI